VIRSIEPCLCGDPACKRCFPASYASEGRMEWIAGYFEGKRCATCPHHHEPIIPNVDTGCGVIDGDVDLEECPALQAEETSMAEDYESDRYEARQRARREE